METSFYNQNELKALGFKTIGNSVLISKKASFYGIQNISLANDIRIDDFCILSGKISIGNYVHIGAGCFLFGDTEGITIDDFSGCSPRVCIYAISDDYSGNSLTNPTIPIKYKMMNKGAVIIEKYVIIGSGSIILPSVRIGEGCAIGSLCSISRDTEPWKIYLGNPAKPIKNRSKNLLELEKELLRGEL